MIQKVKFFEDCYYDDELFEVKTDKSLSGTTHVSENEIIKGLYLESKVLSGVVRVPDNASDGCMFYNKTITNDLKLISGNFSELFGACDIPLISISNAFYKSKIIGNVSICSSVPISALAETFKGSKIFGNIDFSGVTFSENTYIAYVFEEAEINSRLDFSFLNRHFDGVESIFYRAKFNCANKITLGASGYGISCYDTDLFDRAVFCDGMVLDIDLNGEGNRNRDLEFNDTVFKETKFSDRFVVDDDENMHMFTYAVLPDFITATKPSEVVKQFNEHYEVWKRNNPDKAIDDSPSVADKCRIDLIKLIKSGKTMQEAIRVLAVKYPGNESTLNSIYNEVECRLSGKCAESIPAMLGIVSGSKYSRLTVGEAREKLISMGYPSDIVDHCLVMYLKDEYLAE